MRRAARVFALLIALCLGAQGCVTAPPAAKPPPGAALAPQPTGALAAVEQRLRALHGEDVSGFRLLRSNEEALAWRLALIDSAAHSLDLQYYVWFGDKVGQLLLARVIAAADRGVKVRLLFDDLNTMLHDMGHVELRDAALARIDRHRNIQIRVFNAWRERTLAGRVLEMATDFARLNRRMHNKQMIADNRVAVIGGRNIGDEYFGLNAHFNFLDLDALGVGPVAREASAVFDRYWNSGWVRGLPRDAGEGAAEAPSQAEREALEALESDARARLELAGQRSWRREIDALASTLHPGRSRVHTDAPSRAASRRNHMPEAFRALMRSAQREIILTNAYIIPDEAFIADLRSLAARGVSVRILTNSLASHDVPAVNSHYERWRERIVDAGAALHELRPDAALADALVHTPPVRGRFVGLHTKAMVIDRRHAFVGSMNLDPRSETINSEMGVVIDSEPLAQSLAASMEEGLLPANSWRIERGNAGLVWRSDAGLLTRQPARSGWQRVQNLFFKLFPPSLY